MIDLEAVRKRWRESYDEGGALYWLRGEYPATTDDLMVDIDALIAEVEGLRRLVSGHKRLRDILIDELNPKAVNSAVKPAGDAGKQEGSK